MDCIEFAQRMIPYLKILNLITSAKSLLPCKGTQSQVSGLRAWASFGGHYYTTPCTYSVCWNSPSGAFQMFPPDYNISCFLDRIISFIFFNPWHSGIILLEDMLAFYYGSLCMVLLLWQNGAYIEGRTLRPLSWGRSTVWAKTRCIIGS